MPAKTTTLLFSILLLSGCTQLDNFASSRNDPEPETIIQAHRGGGDARPENTLPSFEYSWTLGVVPEADVRTSKDGVMVAFHDKDFKRLVKDAPPELAERGVRDLTWAELSRLDVGACKGDEFAGQRIPSMKEVFTAMRSRPGRLLYVDIKDVDLEQLADAAREYHVERQLILASTDDFLIRRWKELLPQSRTLLWMGGTQARLEARLAKQREVDFAGVDQLQIHVKVAYLDGPEPFTPSADFLRSVAQELRSRDILFQVLPQNTREAAAYTKLMELGVQSFATDDPKVALQAASDYRGRAR